MSTGTGDEEVQGVKLRGARGYVDDIGLHGDEEILLRHLDDIHRHHLHNDGHGASTQEVFSPVGEGNIGRRPTARNCDSNGCIGVCKRLVMSVPVGTDAFVEQMMEAMVDAHIAELEAVKYFSKQLQWTLLQPESDALFEGATAAPGGSSRG